MRPLVTLLIVGLTLQVSSAPILATPAPPTPLSCVGDCDGDGAVTVDELITGVNLALGALPLVACPAFDFSRDGSVTIDELLTAVNAALSGCPGPPTRFPVGAYFWPDRALGDTSSALRDLANFGLNTVVAYYEYIKPDVPPFSGQPDCHGLVREAETFGIDFFVGSPQGSQLRSLDDAALTARLRATVDCVGSSPRYRGWMFDEPELTGYDPALLERVIRTLRALDPSHQVWVNLNPYATDEQLRSFGVKADVLGFDIYPIPEGHGLPNENLSVVGEYTERAERAAPTGADVWMILQAFGYSDLDEGTEGRRPTPTSCASWSTTRWCTGRMAWSFSGRISCATPFRSTSRFGMSACAARRASWESSARCYSTASYSVMWARNPNRLLPAAGGPVARNC